MKKEADAAGRKSFDSVQLRALFNLNDDPFRAQGAFFPGGGRQALLDDLRHQVHFSERLLVLTGERGTGKTRLVRELIRLEKDALHVLTVDGARTNQREALARQLVNELEQRQLGDVDNEAPSEALCTMARRLYELGRRTLIVVDNAQQLSDEALGWMLKSLAIPCREYLTVLWVGSPELVAALQRLPEEAVREHVRQMLMRPFSREESDAYVRFRLEQAGWNGKPVVDDELLERLYGISRGLPGRLAKMAPTVMAGAGQGFLKSGLPAYRWLGGLAVGILIGSVMYVVWRYQQEASGGLSLPGEPAESVQQVGTVSQNSGLQLQPTPMAVKEEPLTPLAEDTVTTETNAEKGEDEATDPESHEKRQKVEQLSHAVEMPLRSADVSASPSEATSTASRAASVDGPSTLDAKASSVAASDMGGSKQPATGAAESGDKKVKATPAATNASVTAPKATRPQPGSPEWVRSRPPEHYALQLTGSVNKASAQAFARKWEKLGLVYVVDTRWKGKDWYVVLKGDYGSKPDARKALASLPEALRKQGAWIRTFASVQTALKE